MSKNCIDIHTPHLKSKFNKLIKSGVKEKDAELEIALEEAKRIFNSLNNLKTKLGLKLSEEDEITNAIVTAKAEDFQDLSETFDLEGELKTKIDALEKIIKDAESEDAPATVKQKLIEKGNAKLAEMKAELAAMQQSKNETNSIDDKKADIEGRSGLNGVEEIIFSNPNFRLEGFEIDGNYWNVVTSTDRAKVLVNINGVIVPFYLTTGQAGKGLVPGWYPFFGIGKDGWLNKTDKSDMETYYERYWGKETADIVKSISEELNSFYGTNPSTFKNDGDPNATSRPLTTLADKVEDYINSKLNYTPAINNADARKTLRSNVEQLGREINAKYDAELAALTKQDTPETEISGKEQLDALFGEVVTPQPTEKQETPIEKLRRLAKEKIEESKLQSTSEFNYRGGTYTIDYNRNLLSPIPKTATAQKNLIDSIGKQDIYDVINSTINSKDVYLVFNKNLNKFVVLDKNLNSIPLDESVVTSKAYQDAKNRCK